MSYEEGVTPFEAVLDTALAKVTPWLGKGALGTWRFVEGGAAGHRAGTCHSPKGGRALGANHRASGVDVSQHLSLGDDGKAPVG